MALELKRFDQELLDVTNTQWNQQLEVLKELVFAPNFLQKLDLVQRKIDDNSGTIHVYGIVDESVNSHAVAIVELSHAMPRSSKPWLKMLNLTVQPALDINAGLVTIDDLTAVASVCIGEVYSLIYKEHPSLVLKILGNNTLSVDFLRAAAIILKENGIKAETQGGWLVIEKKELDS